jgi:cell wall-associated NlpC family hydrolase
MFLQAPMAPPAPTPIAISIDSLSRSPRLVSAGAPAASKLFARLAQVSRSARLVSLMVAAGDRIARLPYVWGGGHGSFAAAGYDCSGSVSYVLHAAGLLVTPETAGTLESYGAPGPGRLVTIYASGGHAWMTIAGRRFDTIALQETGTRWSSTIPSPAGYVVRHPFGL